MSETTTAIMVDIDPTNPGKKGKILIQLLENFKNNKDENVLRKHRKNRSFAHEVNYNGKLYKVRLTHSISKPESNDSSEFYIRTKEELGDGAFGTVKRAAYRLRLNEDGLSILPGILIYKRLTFKKYERVRGKKGGEAEFKRIAKREIAMINKRYGLNIQLIENNPGKTNFSVHFFVPFIPGKCLEQHGKKLYYTATKDFNMQKKLSCTRQLFRDLDFMHTRKKIAHMDIKPGNLIVTKHGQLRLIDFGLAKKTKHQINDLVGTPGYIAPEILGKSSYLPREADMYSSAMTFWAIVTGHDLVERARIGPIRPKLTLDLPLMKADLMSASPNKKLTAIFTRVFDNLSQNDPGKRLNADQAETLVSIISSQLFNNYLKNQKGHFDFNESLRQNVKKYSFQDLFYMLHYNKNPEEFKNTLKLIFDKDKEKIKSFQAALFNQAKSIEGAYHEKLSQQLAKLAKAFGKRSKEDGVDGLIRFIQGNPPYDFDTLVARVEKTLIHLADAQHAKKAKKTTSRYDIDKILSLDHFILEQISPAVLEKAYELRPNKFARTFTQLFGVNLPLMGVSDKSVWHNKKGIKNT